MKKIIIGILIFIFITSESSADYIVYYKLKNISHPVLDFNDPKPLIIDFEYQWNGRDIGNEKIICTPMVYKRINIQQGKEIIDYKRSTIIYYDAYKRPDGKGFIIFRKHTEYEGTEEFEEIQIWDLSHQNYVFLEPHGTKMYFSSDNKFLVTILFPYTEGDSESSIVLTMYYYDLSNLPFLHNKPTKEVKIKMPELQKFSLIKLK